MSQARMRIDLDDCGMDSCAEVHDDTFHLARLSRFTQQMGALLNDIAKALRHVDGRNSVKDWTELPSLAARIMQERDDAVAEMATWQVPEGGARRVDRNDPRIAAMFAVDRMASKAGRLALPSELLHAADMVDPARRDLAAARTTLRHLHKMLRRSVDQETILRAVQAALTVTDTPPI